MIPRPRWGAGLLSLGALGAGAYGVAVAALPLWVNGLGPRLWSTWWFLATFVLATVSFGQFIVRRCSKTPRDGTWALSFSAGTIVFAAAIGLFGWLGWIGWPFFWLLPLTMTLVGLPALRDALVEAHAAWRTSSPFSPIEFVALLFAGACLGLLLLQVIAPDNVNYDSVWYHLRAAERNALANAIVRTPEGDMLLALPSATSWLYTWAFLAPQFSTEDKIVLALHLEFSVFIGTMAFIPALVRALVPAVKRTATRMTWVALFFFPSVFIYDTGLMGGADHMVALWAGAVVLAWIQARERDDASSWVLLGVQIAGLSAKYSSIYLLVPFIPAMLGDAVWRGRAKGLFPSLRNLFVAAGVTLVLTAPYWLRNWVWYHNPVYPSANSLFPSTPWNEDAKAWQDFYALSNVFTVQVSSGAYRLESTLASLFDYQQRIYGWRDMMGDQSVMGSGYWLSMLVLPFLPERRRLFALAVLLNLGIAVWFNTHQHHMRYLTVLTPLMAAGMAATALSLWDMGWPSRVGVLGIVVLLVSAYADVPFRKTHRMSRHSSPVENAGEYIATRGPQSTRVKTWREIGLELPPQARPLVHGIEPHLGLPRLTVTDAIGLQFGINYARAGSVGAAWKLLRGMGVTHLIWSGDVEQPDSIAGEAIFMALAKSTVNQKVLHGLHLGELTADEPPAEPGTHVVYIGCNEQWKTGLYLLATLAEPLPPMHYPWPALSAVEPLTNATWVSAVSDERVGWVVQEESCQQAAPAGFVSMGRQRGSPSYWRYFVRQR